MKKIFKLLIFFTFLIILCSCNQKEKSEYKLIEITTNDLITALNTDNSSLSFATIDTETSNYQNYYEDLEKLSQKLKQDIYYVDGTRTYFWDDETFYLYTSTDIKNNNFYVIENGNIKLNLEYKSYEILYNNLKKHTFPSIKIITSDEEKKAYLATAQDEYNEGNIISSFELLQKAWTLKASKDFYENSSYFNLFNEWVYIKQDNNKMKYKKIVFYDSSTTMYEYNYNGLKTKFKEPTASDYESYEYKIKENKIYIKEDQKYIEKYEIISITKNLLTIKDKKQAYNLYVE